MALCSFSEQQRKHCADYGYGDDDDGDSS